MGILWKLLLHFYSPFHVVIIIIIVQTRLVVYGWKSVIDNQLKDPYPKIKLKKGAKRKNNSTRSASSFHM